MDDRKLWDTVYTTKGPENVSWFQPHLERSLAFLDAAQLPKSAAVIDVGGGASTLVDDLLDRGYPDVTVLDLSDAALEAARTRLKTRGDGVHWICADITDAQLPRAAYDFWHDRAVFHFLRDPAARSRYVEAVRG